MGVSKWIKRRWAAHNQRLLDDELLKEATDPGGIAGGGTADVNPNRGVDGNLAQGVQGGASGPTGPAQ